MFSYLLRFDSVYTNQECTKFSMVRVNDQYMTFSENIEKRYPRYMFDSRLFITNRDDIYIDLEDHKKLLLSVDLDHYEQIKNQFFGT